MIQRFESARRLYKKGTVPSGAVPFSIMGDERTRRVSSVATDREQGEARSRAGTDQRPGEVRHEVGRQRVSPLGACTKTGFARRPDALSQKKFSTAELGPGVLPERHTRYAEVMTAEELHRALIHCHSALGESLMVIGDLLNQRGNPDEIVSRVEDAQGNTTPSVHF